MEKVYYTTARRKHVKQNFSTKSKLSSTFFFYFYERALETKILVLCPMIKSDFFSIKEFSVVIISTEVISWVENEHCFPSDRTEPY